MSSFKVYDGREVRSFLYMKKSSPRLAAMNMWDLGTNRKA